MRLLIDTQALVWFTMGSARLGPDARGRLEESECVVSAAAVWEIAIKRAANKLPIPPPGPTELVDLGFVPLPVMVEHAIEAGKLPRHHADPFDRMMVAQARLEDLTLLTADAAISAYEVPIIDAAA